MKHFNLAVAEYVEARVRLCRTSIVLSGQESK